MANRNGINGKKRWAVGAVEGFGERQDFLDWAKERGYANLSELGRLRLQIEWFQTRERFLLRQIRSLKLRHENVLHRQLRQQGLAIDSPTGEAFIAGWVNGTGRTALQVPLFLEERLRAFYIAGFAARRG